MADGSRMARSYWGPLYNLLLELFPSYRGPQGILDIPRLGLDIGRSNEGIYQWLRDNKITLDGAKRIIELSKKHGTPKRRAKAEDFIPFLFA